MRCGCVGMNYGECSIRSSAVIVRILLFLREMEFIARILLFLREMEVAAAPFEPLWSGGSSSA